MSEETSAREQVLAEYRYGNTNGRTFEAVDQMADEIVRLRAELKRLRAARKGFIDLDALREGGVV